VVLTAGFGQRLRPLTDWMPKPLLPIAGKPVLARTLESLVAAGCEAVAMNLHHLGEPIRRRFGRAVGGVPVHYSEEREIQGTLGGLVALREFAAGADCLVVINGDSLCRWPLGRLLVAHRRSGADATLMMAARAHPAEFSPVGVDRDGWVVSFRQGAPPSQGEARVYAGAQVLSPKLLDGLEARPSDLIADLYQPLLARGGRIKAWGSSRNWHDLGTPERYLRAARDWGRGRVPLRWVRRSWVGPQARVESGARVVRSVIERGAIVAAGAVVESSLVLPGGRVAPGCRLRDSIVGFETELPPGTQVEHRLVCPERADVHPHPGDSVLGGLIYSPMDRKTAVRVR
jgi:mannose-1-phosphate guanylyltransferase